MAPPEQSTSSQAPKVITRAAYRNRLIEDLNEDIKTGKSYDETTSKTLVKLTYRSIKDTYDAIIQHFEDQEMKCKYDDVTHMAHTTENRILKNKVYGTVAWLLELLPQLDQDSMNETLDNSFSAGNNSNSNEPRYRPKNNLPKIQIPKFSGDVEEWNEFEELFSSLVISNNALSDIEKLQYLRSHLAEAPANTIKHIISTQKSFSLAWKALKQRYGIKKTLIEASMRKFFEIKALKQNDIEGLRTMIDITHSMKCSLELQDIDTTTWDPIIVFSITQKFDEKTMQYWEDSLANTKDYPALERLINFIESRIIIEQRIRDRKPVDEEQPAASKNTIENKAQKVNLIKNNREPKCTVCAQAHKVYECKQLSTITIPERIKLIKKLELCENCLFKHSSDCKSKYTCKVCSKQHHTLLHMEASAAQSAPKATDKQEQPNSKSESTTKVLYAQKKSNNQNSILATAIVPIKTLTGDTITVRALLDQGSQANFITERTFKMLNQKAERVNIPVVGINRNHETRVKQKTNISISSIHNDQFKYDMQALIVPNITNVEPNHAAYQKKWPHVQNLPLADPNHVKSGEIDLLIGAASYGHLLLYGVRKCGKNRPILQETHLGWILSGACNNSPDNESQILSAHCSTDELHTKQNDEDVNLTELFNRFFEAEQIHNIKEELSEDDKRAEEYFVNKLDRHENGKLIVGLPFKEDPNEPNFLGESFKSALIRFLQTERKLNKNTELKKQYSDTINEYLHLGHMRISTHEDLNHPWKYYVPHHAVLKLDSETTKLRVVYDASNKTTNGKSLNDRMLPGPKLQKNLFDILLQWRKYPIGFCADIEKMYRQIYLTDPDAKFQRILWRNNENDKIKEYIIHTVMFGNTAAPFLAIRSLFQVAKETEKSNKEIAELIRNNFYVDDFFGGAETAAEAANIQKNITQILQEYGFPLRKWKSNSREFLEAIQTEISQDSLDLIFEKTHKSLGIKWNPTTDEFIFSFNLEELPGKFTKRTLASYVMRLYDPLGFLAPVILTAKILLQSVWLLPGVNWDDELPETIKQSWIKIHDDINKSPIIKIPRWLQTSALQLHCELHGFADASEKAYAAVIYLVVTNENNKTTSTIVASKTRVAPAKPATLPRLELNAAVLITELMTTIQATLQLSKFKRYFWTDSTIVLSWIASPAARWKTYVANRVARIQELTDFNQWRHINSEDNPADCASRGLKLHELKQFKLWWQGPAFLINSQVAWPPIFQNIEKSSVEERKIKALTTQIDPENELLHRFESLHSLQFSTAFALRWINRKPNYIIPSVQELKHALLHWIRLIQQEAYPEEIEALKQGKQVASKSKLTPLSPMWDKTKQVILVGGRLQNSSLAQHSKHQIILPSNNYLTTLLIRQAHMQTFHGGLQLTRRLLRERYWIIHDKITVRKIIHKCVNCFRYNKQNSTQLMGNLPAARTNISRPFTHTGVDFAGYFSVKLSDQRNAPYMKCYVALFICLATKAVHLELVKDLSTNTFIEAIKDFSARRGIPSHIYSDNGTNFVGANNEMPNILQQHSSRVAQDMVHALAKIEIQWHFNPARAPNFGGLWESNVKSMKLHLYKTLKERKLRFDEFHSILVRIEATLNSRPLCPMSTDPADESVITPGHLLHGFASNTLPEPDISEIPANNIQRYQHRSQLHQQFWHQWSSDYLHQLQMRSKWHKILPNAAVGQLVLIHEDNLPPTNWMMGRITRVSTGSDGVVRAAELSCRGRTITRPINKLSILPIEDNFRTPDQKDILSSSTGGSMDDQNRP